VTLDPLCINVHYSSVNVHTRRLWRVGFDCISVGKYIGFVCICFNNMCANCNERFSFSFFFSLLFGGISLNFMVGLSVSCHLLLLLGIFYSIFCTGYIYLYI
jgi:hypothetical protein